MILSQELIYLNFKYGTLSIPNLHHNNLVINMGVIGHCHFIASDV